LVARALVAKLRLMFTHWCLIIKFADFEKLKEIKYIHILNSGGILKFSKIPQSNLVRAGIIMYGVYGEGVIENLKRVFTLQYNWILLCLQNLLPQC